ncbi:MAG: hypothetical protein A2081_05440 [Elusimicrobia bacterium GWC2_61_19]|nr:MAG: hypothetical protein A2081_05440 [Elusimicrobia bacterium GWC2_61_19]
MANNTAFLMIALLTACAAPARAQVQVSTPAATVEQMYRPVNQRDPLVPATVYGDQKGTGKTARTESSAPGVAKGSFTVYGLVLTGILEDSRGRQALLRDQATGLLYTLRAGHLFDSKKKIMPGISGVVKGKQVIFLTEDKKVHQLNLRERE